MIQRTFHTNIVTMVTARMEVRYGAVEAIIQSELQARARDSVDAAGAFTKASGRRRGWNREGEGEKVEGEWGRKEGESGEGGRGVAGGGGEGSEEGGWRRGHGGGRGREGREEDGEKGEKRL